MTRVGITGARGFIGSHILSTLQEQGMRVVTCDRPSCDLLQKPPPASFVKGADAIIHTAAVNRGSDTEIIAGSVVATHNFLSAVEKARSKPKLIFLSSIHAEGDTVYGQSKQLVEVMLRDFSKCNNIPVTVFRLTNVFGEGNRLFYNSVVATFCYQVAHGKNLTVKNGSSKLCLIYVGDVVKLVLKEIGTRRKQLFFFKKISSRNVISVAELARLIQSFRKLESDASLKSKFHKDLYRTYRSYA